MVRPRGARMAPPYVRPKDRRQRRRERSRSELFGTPGGYLRVGHRLAAVGPLCAEVGRAAEQRPWRCDGSPEHLRLSHDLSIRRSRALNVTAVRSACEGAGRLPGMARRADRPGDRGDPSGVGADARRRRRRARRSGRSLRMDDVAPTHAVTVERVLASQTCSGGGTRTHNLRINSPPLCQLSYPGTEPSQSTNGPPPPCGRVCRTVDRKERT
jgi:hypothetical protein